MKKQFTSLFAVILSLALSACGGSPASDAISSTQSSADISVSSVAESTAIEETPAFEEQTIVDNEYCSMILQDIDESGTWGYSWKVYLENKTDKNLMFSIDDCSINGIMVDPFWAESVAAGKKSVETISWLTSLLNENGISTDNVTQVSFDLRVYDSDDWSADSFVDDVFTVYPMGEEKASIIERTSQDTDIVLFDNDICSMIVTGFDPNSTFGYSVKVYLVNKTDKDLIFSVNNASINGFMCDPFFASSVAAGKVKNTSIDWLKSTLDESGIESVEEIELPICVRYEDDWSSDDVLNETYTLIPQ